MLNAPITGVILAGGRATRWGGVDKGLIELDGRPLVAHVLAALAPQVAEVIINANRNRDRYASFGCAVVADADDGYLGPLAGLASAMEAARHDWVVTVPCDSPLIADDLVARLAAAVDREGADAGVASDGEHLQPVFMLVRTRLYGSLRDYLESGERKIVPWLEQHSLAVADLSDQPLTFENLNRPEDAERVKGSSTP